MNRRVCLSSFCGGLLIEELLGIVELVRLRRCRGRRSVVATGGEQA